MKKCIVVTRFAPDQPGYLDFAYRVSALAKRYEVTLVTDHPLDIQELRIAGVAHHVIPESFGTTRGHLLRYLWRSSQFIAMHRPDCVVLLHTLTAPLKHLLVKTPTALYWNEHAIRFKAGRGGSFLKRLFREWIYHYLFINSAQKVELLMPIGEAHFDDLIEHGCSQARTKLIYMGVDEKFRGVALMRKRQNDDPIELIYTGTVQKARGRDVMLEGLTMAVNAGIPVRLTMVGANAEELEHCNTYAHRLGISDHLDVLGRVPGYEIPKFIARADAGVCIWEDQPWWRFNPPTKLFEYLVAGLPVLGSNIRTHTQYITNMSNGIIFEYDKASFAGAIEALWQRRAELARLKEGAFESSSPYLWTNIEPVFLDCIAELAHERQ